MRLTSILTLGLLASCLPAGAQPNANSPQISAACADALDTLEREVLAAAITPQLTVGDLVDRIGGMHELQGTLRTARRLGAPRWLDDQTAQVQVVIGGREVADALLQSAKVGPNRSPIPFARLQRQLSSWRDRTFSAVGISTAGANIVRLKPPPGDRAWQGVGDAARQRALLAARDVRPPIVADDVRCR